ncbi:MAG: two-component system response regulator CreB [Verrucomicrobia bacterium]|nr:two-component system response regulator CreB [Verrucomicrobiota bacterium]MBU4216217.1 two-component system response regulator CreB [Actinomycetota bacterium]MBU4427768.1 two-component system response regulator CreB [Verrucomicrobiota bacterium]MBU4496881.1 two-component system response regulator CreB [Verrucomicrobiota bacterium]MCG2678444.1 two-component system response regulator CreB [Kiritimatiellia bacterium]
MALRILIVEDEQGIVDNVTYALETEGFATVSCKTGAEALQALAKGSIDLIILDIGLPDRTGFDLCKDIRKTSSVPIIFLTARAKEVDRIVGLELGGDDYVVKPFSPRELAARVKAVFRRLGNGEARPAAAKTPFQVDKQRCVISYFGQPLDLSRYEFKILEVLIEKPGRVFSREQIMERAWEEPEASLDRTVDTHIKTLRAKLHKIRPKADPIQTHRGFGYALKESW